MAFPLTPLRAFLYVLLAAAQALLTPAALAGAAQDATQAGCILGQTCSRFDLLTLLKEAEVLNCDRASIGGQATENDMSAAGLDAYVLGLAEEIFRLNRHMTGAATQLAGKEREFARLRDRWASGDKRLTLDEFRRYILSPQDRNVIGNLDVACALMKAPELRETLQKSGLSMYMSEVTLDQALASQFDCYDTVGSDVSPMPRAPKIAIHLGIKGGDFATCNLDRDCMATAIAHELTHAVQKSAYLNDKSRCAAVVDHPYLQTSVLSGRKRSDLLRQSVLDNDRLTAAIKRVSAQNRAVYSMLFGATGAALGLAMGKDTGAIVKGAVIGAGAGQATGFAQAYFPLKLASYEAEADADGAWLACRAGFDGLRGARMYLEALNQSVENRVPGDLDHPGDRNYDKLVTDAMNQRSYFAGEWKDKSSTFRDRVTGQLRPDVYYQAPFMRWQHVKDTLQGCMPYKAQAGTTAASGSGKRKSAKPAAATTSPPGVRPPEDVREQKILATVIERCPSIPGCPEWIEKRINPPPTDFQEQAPVTPKEDQSTLYLKYGHGRIERRALPNRRDVSDWYYISRTGKETRLAQSEQLSWRGPTKSGSDSAEFMLFESKAYWLCDSSKFVVIFVDGEVRGLLFDIFVPYCGKEARILTDASGSPSIVFKLGSDEFSAWDAGAGPGKNPKFEQRPFAKLPRAQLLRRFSWVDEEFVK